VITAIDISVAGETRPAAFASAENKSNSTGANLWAPFGLHTDDLDAMVKRRNIRALVLINPIGFFYDNGHPMGIMYDALDALQTYVNQKFKTGALKIQISFVPVRADQAETALMQGVGDFVAYALVVTPQRQQQAAGEPLLTSTHLKQSAGSTLPGVLRR
jgi:membrane-bound lytic murein transglycosylase MltF